MTKKKGKQEKCSKTEKTGKQAMVLAFWWSLHTVKFC